MQYTFPAEDVTYELPEASSVGVQYEKVSLVGATQAWIPEEETA
jgi:hypothetical protein